MVITITTNDWEAFSLSQKNITPTRQRIRESHTNPKVCSVGNCNRNVKRHKEEGYAYSKYCVKHTQHAIRHGHPVKKIPRVTNLRPQYRTENSDQARTAYLAGRQWLRDNLDTDLLQSALRRYTDDLSMLEDWEAPSIHIRASDMELNTRWKWYRHNLLVKHKVTPLEVLMHQVGLLVVLKKCSGIFVSDRMKHQFLATRWLQLKPLPMHGADAYTKKMMKHGTLDSKTAKFIHDRLEGFWEMMLRVGVEQLEELISTKAAERVYRAKQWSEASREAVGRHTKKRHHAYIRTFKCMTTGATFGQLISGELRVIHRGRASDGQLQRLASAGGL